MRRYVCSVVLSDWLGLPWRHQPEARIDVAISLEGNPGQLRMPDVLFSLPETAWLTSGSLPRLPLAQWDSNSALAVESTLVTPQLPILFGVAAPVIVNECTDLRLPFDLLGSIFFMLSAYEELVCSERDAHGRFPGRASLACRSDFISRPLADEYSEVLWHAFRKLWPQLQRKKLNSKVLLSCDVDQPFDCTVSSFRALFRAGMGDIIKRKTPTEASRRIVRFIKNRRGDFSSDPCYTFDKYIELCSEHNLRAAFYFIPTSSSPMNGCYSISDVKIKRLMRKIVEAGHEIGMHGCYEAYRDSSLTEAHRDLFITALREAGIDQPLIGNRQHYLRWDSVYTPVVLDKANFVYDTSGGYADCAGFRFGSAREFQMWDWLGETKLKLRQRPLIVMDCSVTDDAYMGLGTGAVASEYIKTLRDRALRFGGQFTLLWHNTSLSREDEIDLLHRIIDRNNA
jgi:peptidoglycan/xylan/chitin deacetylase (PgdA/CDA1 family)